MTDNHKIFLSIGKALKDAQESQLFGKPCFKINGKAFMCFFEDDVVFKLSGASHKSAIALQGAQLFDPAGKGRPMKAWVQVPANHKDQWQNLATESMAYVNEINK